MSGCPHGFRVVGGVETARRITTWSAAFAAHAGCDERAELDKPSYLSMFTFDESLRTRVLSDGCTVDVRGYDGPCYSDWLWFDIDRPDLDAALQDGRRLARCSLQQFGELDDDDLLLFFSGSKGFHVGIPTTLFRPDPSQTFNKVCKLFAAKLAERAGVTIDATVYDKQRLFRAPNSRHPKTGLHKRWLTFAELMHLSADRIRELAKEPAPFDVPTATATSDNAASLWAECERAVTASQTEGADRRRAGPLGKLQRATLDLLHCAESPEPGERERRLFRAAANLTEAGCPAALVGELLDRPGRGCGLTASELRHAIESGINHAARERKGG